MITKFDKKDLPKIGAEAAAELASWAAKHGLAVSYSGGKFSDIEFKMSLTLKVADPASRDAARRKEWDMTCAMFDLLPSDLGAFVSVRNDLYKVVGFTNRGKFPFLCQNVVSGTETSFSELMAHGIRAARGK